MPVTVNGPAPPVYFFVTLLGLLRRAWRCSRAAFLGWEMRSRLSILFFICIFICIFIFSPPVLSFLYLVAEAAWSIGNHRDREGDREKKICPACQITRLEQIRRPERRVLTGYLPSFVPAGQKGDTNTP